MAIKFREIDLTVRFPYRITLNGWMFIAAGIFVVLVALVTVSFQAIRAAMANPVKSLRTE